MAFNISYIYVAKDKFTAVANRVGATASRVKRKFSGMAVQAQKTGVGLDNLGMKMTGLMAVMASLAIFAAPIKDAIAFESSLADLNKVLEFELPNGLATTGKAIQELSKRIPIAQVGLVEIATAGAQLGIVERDIISFTETVSKISVAFDMMPGEAGNAVAKLSNIFQIPVTEFEGFADAINEVSNNTASSANEIVRALTNKGAAAGRIMGMTKETTLALASTFIQLGVNASRVGSIMDSMSRRLSDPAIVGGAFAAKFAEKPQENLLKLLRTIKGLKGVQKAQVLSQVFGEFSGRVGILADTMDERLIPTLNLATDRIAALGSVTKEFENRAATTANKTQLMKNKFEILSTNVGSIFLPAMNGILFVLGGIAEGLAWATEKTGAFIPMILAAGGVMALVAGIATVFGVAVTWPFLLIAGGIAAAIVGIGWLFDKIEELGGITNVFKLIGNAIVDFFLLPLTAVAAAIDFIGGTDLSGKLDAMVNEFKFDVITPDDMENKLKFDAVIPDKEALVPITNKTESTMDININAPPGIIQSVETKNKGNIRTNVGQNMALGGAM